MEQFDLEKLDKALIYVDRIANGKNPINNLLVDEDYVLNDPNVIRCMFFIKDILSAVKENGGSVSGKKTKNKMPKKKYPVEALRAFKAREKLTITPFVRKLNEGIDKDTTEVVKVKPISEWLKENGYLYSTYSEKLNKDVTMSTEKGKALGITSEYRIAPDGSDYCRVEYSIRAQEEIVKNLPKIMHLEDEEIDEI